MRIRCKESADCHGPDWQRAHIDKAGLLREVICGAQELLKSLPAGFAFSVECNCSCCFFYFLMSFYFGLHYLREL